MKIRKPVSTPAGYLTVREAAEKIGIDRPSSLNHYLKQLDIMPYRPPHGRHPYLSESDIARIQEYRRMSERANMGEQGHLVMWAIRTLRLERADITTEAVQSLLVHYGVTFTKETVQAAMDTFIRRGYRITEYPPDVPLLRIPLQSKAKVKE